MYCVLSINITELILKNIVLKLAENQVQTDPDRLRNKIKSMTKKFTHLLRIFTLTERFI